MKYLLLTLLLICSCNINEQDTTTTTNTTALMAKEEVGTEFDKKKDAGCATEDELKKEIEAAAKKAQAKHKPQAITLQGGDTGCSTDTKAE